MIRGITHDTDGRPKVRRTVTTKLAIGLPPEGGRNYPTKLDHIAFLKKVYTDKEIKWVTDEELTAHYKQQSGDAPVRELWITFLDDDIETVFPTKWGAYVTRGLFCRGDGEHAERRPKHEREWNPFEEFKGPCANGGCPLADAGDCKPNGTLYFFLRDFPKLGSLCKLQTTSWQSIQQLYSALQDLRSVTGGRLMGVSVKLFIHPDKTVYEGKGGTTQTGMKWCWGLELAASDLADMGSKLLETAKTFREIKGELNGRVLEVEEDEAEVATEMRREFYPEATHTAEPVADPDKDIKEKISRLLREELKTDKSGDRFNDARIQALLGQYAGRLPELLGYIEKQIAQRKASTNGAALSSASQSRDQNGRPRGNVEPAAVSAAPEPDRTPPATNTQPRTKPAQSGFGF